MDCNRELNMKIIKEAVMSFRVVELKDCLKMLKEPLKRARKAELQKRVLCSIDSLRNVKKNIPPSFLLWIFQLQRRSQNKGRKKRLTIKQRITKTSIENQASPFFTVIDVLRAPEMLRSSSSIYLNIPFNLVKLLRKKQDAHFTYEIQIMFGPEDENVEGTTNAIQLKVNGKDAVEDDHSPPIIYITHYCSLKKNSENKIDFIFPRNEEMSVYIAVVKRFSPSQLMTMHPVREVSNTKQLLEQYMEQNGVCIYEVTLFCPFEKKIMQLPCRASCCNHPDTFDLLFFLQRMQYYLVWKCPVCKKRITYDSLELETFLKRYLENGKVNFTFYRPRKTVVTGPNDGSVLYSGELITLD